MFTQLIMFVVLFIGAVAIIAATFVLLYYIGNKEIAFESALRGLRWFLAGAVIAALSDVFSNGVTLDIFLPSSVAIAILILCEYAIRLTEEQASPE